MAGVLLRGHRRWSREAQRRRPRSSRPLPRPSRYSAGRAEGGVGCEGRQGCKAGERRVQREGGKSVQGALSSPDMWSHQRPGWPAMNSVYIKLSPGGGCGGKAACAEPSVQACVQPSPPAAAVLACCLPKRAAEERRRAGRTQSQQAAGRRQPTAMRAYHPPAGAEQAPDGCAALGGWRAGGVAVGGSQGQPARPADCACACMCVQGGWKRRCRGRRAGCRS